MFWHKRKMTNRRLGRVRVLDVKLRASKVRAARARRAIIALGVCFGTVFGLYASWCLGELALNKFVYENPSFSIQQIDVQTDGVISRDQLRHWSGVKSGQNLLALDLARVKRDLEMMPIIDSVSVERILPGTLRLRVTERVPVAHVEVPVPRAGGGLDLKTYQLDENGYVMLPLDPRQRAAPPTQSDDAFEGSPMANLVDLRKIDVLSPEVLVVTTGQGSEITFGLENFDQQLLRWQRVQQECTRLNKTIATLNLAVAENTPLRLSDAALSPPLTPKPVAKPQRTRRKNV